MEFSNLPPFDIKTNGSHFLVLVFEDYVVKIPVIKHLTKPERLDLIVYHQNTAARLTKQAPGCYRHDNVIISEIPPGVPAEECRLSWDVLQAKGSKLANKVERAGLTRPEVKRSNMFYDVQTGKVWLVDFSTAGKGGK